MHGPTILKMHDVQLRGRHRFPSSHELCILRYGVGPDLHKEPV